MVAIVTLAVGVGVNAAVFSLLNGWLLRPLPGERDGRLVRLYSQSTKPDGAYQWFSYPYFSTLREKNQSFAGLSAFCPSGLTLRDQGLTRTAIGAYVSSDFFSTLGVRPALGRSFTEAEERPGSHSPVTMISHRFWQGLGGDLKAVGQTLTINDTPLTIIGVLPEYLVSASQITNKEIWLPLGMMGGFVGQVHATPRLSTHDWRRLTVVGQLKPKMSSAVVDSQLKPLALALGETHPAEYGDSQISSGPIGNILMSPGPYQELSIGKPLMAMVAVSGTILLIACLNLAHMFLARGIARRREITIRLALGSSRNGIIRQMAIEGLLLSLIGGAIGTALALWSIRIPVQYFEQWTWGEGTIPIALDGRLVLVGLGLCVLCTLLFSLIPALRLTATRYVANLTESSSNTTVTQTWWRKALISAQIALAFVLVTCAGLFVQSACAAAQSTPGFDLHRGLLIELSTKQAKHTTFGDILAQLRSTPGIQTASMTCTPPYRAFGLSTYQRQGQFRSLEVRQATLGADFFKSLGVPLCCGREFTLAEEQSNDGPRVALIDQVLAQQLWPDESPLGQFLQPGNKTNPSLQVVGVVPHLRDALIETQVHGQVYLPFGHHPETTMFVSTLLFDPTTPLTLQTMKKHLQKELIALDPDLSIRTIHTWPEHIERYSFHALTIKLGAKLFATFGFLALGLAAVGLYGVKSYDVSQRTREIGIRMALGATKANITRHFLREGLLLTLFGLGIGLLLTRIGMRFLESLLFEIKGTDPIVLVSTTIVLAVAVLLASLLPAWRAAKIDPMEALRYE